MRDSNPRPPQCQCDALPTALTAHYLRIPSGDALPPLEKTFTGCFFFGRVLTAHYLKNPFGRCATNLSKKQMFSLWRCAKTRFFCYRGDLPKFLSDNKKDAFCVLYLRNSSGGTRTYNPSVNSRMLCH